MIKCLFNRGVIFSACVALFLSACNKETPAPVFKKVKTEVFLSSSGAVNSFASYEYNSDGKLFRITYSSGDYQEYDYSKSGSISNTYYSKCSGSTCISGYKNVVYSMTLNSMGYRSERTFTDISGTSITNYSIKYEYDNMGFLSKRTTTATGTSSYVETISYNNTYENGNIIKSAVTSSTIYTNSNNSPSNSSSEIIYTYHLGTENTLSNTRYGSDFYGKSSTNLNGSDFLEKSSTNLRRTVTTNIISGNSPSSSAVAYVYVIEDGYVVKATQSSGAATIYTYE